MLLQNIENFNDFLDSLAIYSSNNFMQPEILSRKIKKSIENSLSKNPFHENELNMQRGKIFENFKHENKFQGKSIILQHLGPNKDIFSDSVRILNVESSDDRSSILWFNTKHSNTNRECLFYSITFIPTTSENDNFYRVPAQVCV